MTDGWVTRSSTSYKSIVLDRLKVATQFGVSKELLHELPPLQLQEILDDQLQAAFYQLHGFVWADTENAANMKKTIEVVDHADWKHHLVASLPQGSWRRRYLEIQWRIKPGYTGRRRIWNLSFRKLATYPVAERLMRPEKTGPVVFQVMDRSTYYDEGEGRCYED